MVNVVLNERRACEDFDLESEVCYFKIGSQGLVSFHGKNYNRKIAMSTEKLNDLTKLANYYPINSTCYINIARIKSVSEGTISFETGVSDSKRLPVNRRKQYVIEQLFSQRMKSKETRITN